MIVWAKFNCNPFHCLKDFPLKFTNINASMKLEEKSGAKVIEIVFIHKLRKMSEKWGPDIHWTFTLEEHRRTLSGSDAFKTTGPNIWNVPTSRGVWVEHTGARISRCGNSDIFVYTASTPLITKSSRICVFYVYDASFFSVLRLLRVRNIIDTPTPAVFSNGITLHKGAGKDCSNWLGHLCSHIQTLWSSVFSKNSLSLILWAMSVDINLEAIYQILSEIIQSGPK